MFSAYKYHQDQISLLHCKCSKQLQMSPAAVHSVQNAGPGKSGYLNGPQKKFSEEEQMAQQARQKIQARLKMAKLFQQYRAQLISNKHDVTVTSHPPSKEEKICLTVYENKKVVPLTVKNCGVKTVTLTFWAFDLVKNIFTVRDCHGDLIQTMKQLPLGPGESYKIKVHFDSEHAGFYEQLLVFQIESYQQSSDKLEIMRILEVIHRTSFSEEPLPTATTSVSNLQTMNWTPAEGVGLTWLKLVVPLKGYPMPDNMKDPKKADMDLEKMPLNWGTYCRRFQMLLHVEELQLKTDIEKFNQNAKMFRHKSNAFLLILQLAGVFKNSPMRLLGNNVLVTALNQPGVFENKIYNGWVHHVDAEHVYLQFSEEFLNCFKEGTRYRFNFYLGRMPLRIQHRAVQLAYTSRLKEVLFPTGRFSSHHSHLHRLVELGDNPEQQKAVQHIVAASAKPAPYLVFGPPGTGKTVTLVEAIKRIVETQPSCNILVCAPSNSATDHLFEKILEGKIGEHEVYRLFALSCPVRNIPQNIKSCCNLNRKTNTLMMPPKEELMKYKIMATTLLTAGRLVTGGIPVDHYTYIFVDEAGQATETECIVPIAGLLKQKCQLVLAGDPKQLGAIITSRVAEKHGLGVSLLERLMNDINLYRSHETHGFNNRFVTKLLRNYRSHPAILKIPNELFYNGELQPYAHKEKCNSYRKWEHLPKKGFPLIFHGVAGTNERDASSPSVYNMAEVEVLKEYLKTLVDHLKRKGVTKIQPREIGIIAPYRKQVEKIQKALKTDKDLMKINLENVLVGSVEQFQGKEFNVILVSTVRSNPKLTAHKQRFTIGFVDNEKRFNVAMTRARALLIVVGDPRVLKTDQIWNKLIYYCFQQGAYRGIIVSDAEEEESPLTDAHSPSLCEEGLNSSWTPVERTNRPCTLISLCSSI